MMAGVNPPNPIFPISLAHALMQVLFLVTVKSMPHHIITDLCSFDYLSHSKANPQIAIQKGPETRLCLLCDHTISAIDQHSAIDYCFRENPQQWLKIPSRRAAPLPSLQWQPMTTNLKANGRKWAALTFVCTLHPLLANLPLQSRYSR